MNEIINANTLDSREVAKLVGKSHKNLLADIRGYLENMQEISQLNFQPSDFFIESSFLERGKQYPCYNITRKGCEFIANKLTGQKGTLFTAAYINRFHAMEQVLTSPVQLALPQTPPTAPPPNLDALAKKMFGESTVHMSSMMYLLLGDLPENAVCTITVEKRIADAEMFYKMGFGCGYQAATQKKH